MFNIPKEQVLKLDALHSTARFKHRQTDKGDVTICVLRDKHMGNDWAIAEAPGSDIASEQEALRLALEKAQPGDRPRTPAELAAELAAYKAKYGDLEADAPQQAEAPAPKARGGRIKKAETVPATDPADNNDDDDNT